MYIHLLLHPYVWDNVDAVGHYACLKDQGKDSGKVVELLRAMTFSGLVAV